MARRRKIQTCFYIDPEQKAKLDRLRERTHVPLAELYRQSLNVVLDVAHGAPADADVSEMAQALVAEDDPTVVAVARGYMRELARRVTAERELSKVQAQAQQLREALRAMQRRIERVLR